MKVTPAHDPVDFEIAQRAGLPLMNIFRRGRDDQRERGRGVLRARALRRADRGARGAGEARPDRRGDPAVRPLRRPLLPLSQRDRAVDRRPAVVRRGRSPARSGEGGGPRRPHRVLARTVAAGVRRRGWTTSATGTSPGSCGGDIGSRPGTAPTATSPSSRDDPDRVRHVRLADARAGPRRARHVVLVAAVAVLDARVARRHRRTSGSSTRTPCS